MTLEIQKAFIGFGVKKTLIEERRNQINETIFLDLEDSTMY